MCPENFFANETTRCCYDKTKNLKEFIACYWVICIWHVQRLIGRTLGSLKFNWMDFIEPLTRYRRVRQQQQKSVKIASRCYCPDVITILHRVHKKKSEAQAQEAEHNYRSCVERGARALHNSHWMLSWMDCLIDQFGQPFAHTRAFNILLSFYFRLESFLSTARSLNSMCIKCSFFCEAIGRTSNGITPSMRCTDRMAIWQRETAKNETNQWKKMHKNCNSTCSKFHWI